MLLSDRKISTQHLDALIEEVNTINQLTLAHAHTYICMYLLCMYICIHIYPTHDDRQKVNAGERDTCRSVFAKAELIELPQAHTNTLYCMYICMSVCASCIYHMCIRFACDCRLCKPEATIQSLDHI